MAARSIASLTLSFGLVSIPVKLYSATESAAAVRFKLMAPGGGRLRQQYVAEDEAGPAGPSIPQTPAMPDEAEPASAPMPGAAQEALPSEAEEPPAVVERADMVKGYEFEKGRYVLFTTEELKALAEGSRQTIDIVAFIPERSVDPVYYDKAYFLAPDKRGAKPYSLLLRAMRESGRGALAKWAWRAKEYVVQIRPVEGGLVLQQLLYAAEVRSIADLHVELVDVGEGELQLARQFVEQIAVEAYDPAQYVDEEKQRILSAVERKIAGNQIVAPHQQPAPSGAQVVDLMAALKASLAPVRAPQPAPGPAKNVLDIGDRKPVRRATAAEARPAKRAGDRK